MLSSLYGRLSPHSYGTLCALMVGFVNLLVFLSYSAHVFTVESVLHSVHERDPDRVGPHDGYYGMAVSNAFYMLSSILIVPSLSNYFRCKWVLVLCSLSFIIYYVSFQYLNRYLYFICCGFFGFSLSAFNIGYSGYLTEFSSNESLPRSQALSWGLTNVSVLVAGVVNFLMANANSGTSSSKYRQYSEGEIRVFFGIETTIAIASVILYAMLPNKEVEGSISHSHVKPDSVNEQIVEMVSVLANRQVLILIPFYLYIGLFFSFWVTIIPTTFQFTMALSKNVYVPIYYGAAFTAGSVTTSAVIMKLSSRIHNLCCKPLMVFTFLLHLSIFALTIAATPEWSTVRPNDEPALLIQPSSDLILNRDDNQIEEFLSSFLVLSCNYARTVISSMVMPAHRQQIFGVSRCYHGMAAAALFFGAPGLSIYSYAAILTVFLIAATMVYLYTCSFLEKQETEEKIDCESHSTYHQQRIAPLEDSDYLYGMLENEELNLFRRRYDN
ncbi:hypothetical protein PRIPAC_76249 [Pristionchus pacificus]|uniref:Membrane transporter n=1 Tax=Pristionchus pacificus TaxID=54126 RepID=A0A2A6D0D6_PRIPA|nr:hypothetical protein PRIPAC_76249 [Pristionchus pacificus]|eukprot:PDM83751.1 membrane transporter [Pristionchus pacificus]